MTGHEAPRLQVIDEHHPGDLAGNLTEEHVMTVVVSVPPRHPGTPPHRHSGPVYGYVIEGEMLFELEGDAPVVKRAGDPIWEPGGDRIHYQTANTGDAELRFVAVMICRPGDAMLTLVSDEEIEARRHLRYPGSGLAQ